MHTRPLLYLDHFVKRVVNLYIQACFYPSCQDINWKVKLHMSWIRIKLIEIVWQLLKILKTAKFHGE